MKRRVVITGLGVIAPNGIGKEAFWDALVNGRSGIGRITRFDASTYPSQIAGEVNGVSFNAYINQKKLRKLDRVCQFSLACANMAVEDSNLSIKKEDGNRTGVIVGTMFGGLGIAEIQHSIFLEKGYKRINPFLQLATYPSACSSVVAVELQLNGPCATIYTGCASSNSAIGTGFDYIREDKADIMIVGGVDAPITPFIFASLCQLRLVSKRNDTPSKASRPFNIDRDGMVISEGAGFLILEELEHALKRNTSIYAEVIGHGSTCDGYHLAAPLPNGTQAARAITLALKDAGLKSTDIDYINAHGTSTPFNDKTETLVIKKAFGDYAYNVPISSTKSMIGHAQGASGAIEMVACCLMLQNRFLHPTINYENPDTECDLNYIPNKGYRCEVNTILSNSSGFGGYNAVSVIGRYMC
ncbi:MAG: beta-ketoacyl-ACP synthase II [Desulfobacterales bacterium]|nr:beta-ketoacyl-ACP synthase II [Desulfobacterales bacterium]